MEKPHLDVAIAILLHQSQVLVGWREAKQHQGNKYEFPGGKVEAGETPLQACTREVWEEVGIQLTDWHAFDLIQHEYDDLSVNLHVFHATVSAQLIHVIHDPWIWYGRERLKDLHFPQANQRLIQRLVWSKKIQFVTSFSDFYPNDSTLIYVNDVVPTMQQVQHLTVFENKALNSLIVSFKLWQLLHVEQKNAVFAVHLSQTELWLLQKGDLQCGQRYIAHCQNEKSVIYAQNIGCDAVFLETCCVQDYIKNMILLPQEAYIQRYPEWHLPIFAGQNFNIQTFR